MTTLIREHTPTARKTHACSLCDGLIAAGEQYTRFTIVYDGHVYDFLICTGCKTDKVLARAWSWAYDTDEGVAFETAMEWATEQVVHGSPEEQQAAKNYLARYYARRGDRDE